jgi:hypothetical protein
LEVVFLGSFVDFESFVPEPPVVMIMRFGKSSQEYG